MPVDAETIGEDADPSICLRGVEVGARILEHGRLAQHREAMGEATGHKERAMVVFGQFNRHMLAVGGRSLADIYCNIEDSTLYAAYQLALGIRWTLEVQTSHHAIAAHALIILAEVNTMSQDWGYLLFELSFAETLEEMATSITEEAWLKNENA